MAPISGFSTNDIKSIGSSTGLLGGSTESKVIIFPLNIDDERWAGGKVSFWIEGKQLSRSALYLESHNLHKYKINTNFNLRNNLDCLHC